MSQRPRAEKKHAELREITPPELRRTTSGEHAIVRPDAASPPQMQSGEYRATRPKRDSDAEVSATEVELPPASVRMCDTVHIAGAQGSGVIHLVDGDVAWVATKGFDLPGFGRRLLDQGLVERHELDLVIALCRTERLNFAEMLVQLELVEADALHAAMIEHVAESVKALLAMRSITGRWERTRSTFTGELTVPLDDVLSLQELERWAMVIAHSGGALGERRVEERIPLHVICNVETERDGHVLMMTENVSRTGALLRSPFELELGSIVKVRVTIGSEKLTLGARVVRMREMPTSAQHAVGIRWLDLTEDDDALLARALDSL